MECVRARPSPPPRHPRRPRLARAARASTAVLGAGALALAALPLSAAAAGSTPSAAGPVWGARSATQVAGVPQVAVVPASAVPGSVLPPTLQAAGLPGLAAWTDEALAAAASAAEVRLDPRELELVVTAEDETNDPAPNDPAPNDPAPNDPAPNDPAPNDPAPNDPAPSDPAPQEPKPDRPQSDEPGDDGQQDEPAPADQPEQPQPVRVAPVPPPATPPDLPAQVDPLASYQGQYICSPEAKPGALLIAELIRATYETSSDIWTPRDCAQGGRSEHKEGRAVDWMIDQSIPTENAQAESFLDWLLATDASGEQFAMARRLGIMYIGWGDRIWESYTQSWSELKGCFSKPDDSYDTYCHRDHIHLSLSWDGAAAQTSFWGGDPTPLPACGTAGDPSSEATLVGNGLDYVPVTPRRLLDTRIGLGVPGRVHCRMTQASSGGPGDPLSIDLTRLPGYPGEGVRAVAARVVTARSNSPATLRARTTGDAEVSPIVINGRREMATVIPVASDGTIALTTDSGATHVAVDLLGYFVKPAAAEGIGGRLLAQSGQVAYESGRRPLKPGEKRVIDVALAETTEGPPAAALVSVTAKGRGGSGTLVVRRTGERRTAATTAIAYARDDTTTTNVLTGLDDLGRVTLVNAGRVPVHVTVALRASAVRTQKLGSLFVPVPAAPVEPRRTTLTRVLSKPTDASAAVVRVSLRGGAKGGSVTFWSLARPDAPSLSVARRDSITALIIVPLSRSGTIARALTGGVEVDAAVVGYLR